MPEDVHVRAMVAATYIYCFYADLNFREDRPFEVSDRMKYALGNAPHASYTEMRRFINDFMERRLLEFRSVEDTSDDV